MTWVLPDADERQRQREQIAAQRNAAEPFTADELKALNTFWSEPGVHQYGGMGSRDVFRLLATIQALTPPKSP